MAHQILTNQIMRLDRVEEIGYPRLQSRALGHLLCDPLFEQTNEFVAGAAESQTKRLAALF